MDRTDAYLTIPPGYGLGLRWSTDYSAIESDIETFAVVQQLDRLLEGVFASRRVPHFAHVLHGFHLLRYGGPGGLWRLRDTFSRASTKQGIISRNAGALIAELCKVVPPAAAPPPFEQLTHALKQRVFFRQQSDVTLEWPSVGREEFERRVDEALHAYSGDALHHWLIYGCAPAGDATEKLVEAVVEPPPRVASLAEIVRERPRLVGALALVPALEAALALPPRKLDVERMPQGGYCDVTNHGSPERLLPSQFALEPLDFVRRFAENELLYFRRDEPHRGELPERVVILDQGVRTWGGVRLALAGAALALIVAKKQRGPLRLVFTSDCASPVVSADADPKALADSLEASDLTENPAAALVRALDGDAVGPRDVLLLTHPRALGEQAVLDALTLRRTADRVFALSVDDDGRAILDEWRGGGVVRLRSFRVDLAGALSAQQKRPERARPVVSDRPMWTGDVEPVQFPFAVGLVTDVEHAAFDQNNEWLMTAGRDGALSLVKLDGSPPQVPPRSWGDGLVLSTVEAIFGMAGGFAVCGWLSRHGAATTRLRADIDPWIGPPTFGAVVAYYEIEDRRVKLWPTGIPPGDRRAWHGLSELRCVAVAWDLAESGIRRTAVVDLDTGERIRSSSPPSKSGPRLREALGRANLLRFRPPMPLSRIIPSGATGGPEGPWVRVDDPGGVVSVGGVSPPWPPMLPERDGQRFLAGANVTSAQIAGTTLALAVVSRNDGRSMLYVFDGPRGRLIFEVDRGHASGYQLSTDGRLIAVYPTGRGVAVRRTNDDAATVGVLGLARLHNAVEVELSPRQLTLRIGYAQHVFDWSDNALKHSVTSSDVADAKPQTGIYCPPYLRVYDAKRFLIVAATGKLTAVIDHWGQVVIFQRESVAVGFVIRRRVAAAWLPDGTVWGATELLGQTATPNADVAIARALREGPP